MKLVQWYFVVLFGQSVISIQIFLSGVGGSSLPIVYTEKFLSLCYQYSFTKSELAFY